MTVTLGHTLNSRLSNEVMDYLQKLGRTVRYADLAVIVRRGETGHSFFVVLSGEVEVRLAGASGANLPLARLGERATFGEMALLRDEPVSADVISIGEATVLVCPEHAFRRGISECEPFRLQLLARLAGDLQRTTSEAWDFYQRAEALRLLIHCESQAETLIKESAPMRKLVRSLKITAERTNACLITGEQGTGKLLVARTLHEEVRGNKAPLIIVDCQRLHGTDARRLLPGLQLLLRKHSLVVIRAVELISFLATIALTQTHILAGQRDTPQSPIGWTALSMFCASYVGVAVFLVL